VFVFVAAEYETPQNALNQVSLSIIILEWISIYYLWSCDVAHYYSSSYDYQLLL